MEAKCVPKIMTTLLDIHLETLMSSAHILGPYITDPTQQYTFTLNQGTDVSSTVCSLILQNGFLQISSYPYVIVIWRFHH